MADRIAELAAHNLCLAQTQFDLDVLREVPKDSPQYIDALRSPIPNHLPVSWLVAEQPQQQQPQPADAPASSAAQSPNDDAAAEDGTRDSPGKALLPEDAPLRRGFFALHDLFSPEHAFDPSASKSASDSTDDYSDMPGLGPVIVQVPPPLPSPQSEEPPPEEPQPEVEEEQEQPQTSQPEEPEVEEEQEQPSLVCFDDLFSSDAQQPQPAATPEPPPAAVDVLTQCGDDLDNPFAVPSTEDAAADTVQPTTAPHGASFVDPFAF